MVTARKRSVQIKITLTPELHAVVAKCAEAFGQAPATLCSVWIGQAAAQSLRNLGATQAAIDAMVEKAGPELIAQMRLQVAQDSQ